MGDQRDSEKDMASITKHDSVTLGYNAERGIKEN